ncbi:MAG: hypothetical protein ACQEXG_07690 [Pseudomonadota bacterium]
MSQYGHYGLEGPKIMFSDVTPSSNLLEAASNVPAAMGAYLDEGVFLGGDVLNLQLLDAESTASIIGPMSVDEAIADPLVRLEYTMWVLPKDFDAGDPERLIHMREEIYTRSSLILEGQVVTYGLGVEYNITDYAETEESDSEASDPNLPALYRCHLLDYIKDEWDGRIKEWLDMDSSNIPAGLSKDFRELYQSLIEEEVEAERLQELKRQHSPLWDLDSAEIWSPPDSIGVKVDSWDRQKALVAIVELESNVLGQYTDVEVSLRRRRGPLLIPEQQKQVALLSRSEGDWEDELMALMKSGWIAQHISNN